MAVMDLFGSLKNKARSMYNNFFYNGEEAPAPRMQEEYYQGQEAYPPQQPQNAQWAAQQQYPSGQQVPMGYQQQPYQQPQQPAYNTYQQPQQPVYNASYPQQGVNQPQPIGMNGLYQQPAEQAQADRPRSRRMQHARQENNVVDFGAYQQQNQPQQSQQPAAPEAQAPQNNALLSARVINARNMGDCRSAITLLRNGDAVLIVLESVNEPNEMRRMVDTLSGACYSLTATITKVSRFGVYLLAPQTLAVFTDQITNMMNTAPARGQARGYQPAYQPGQRPAYAAPQGQNRAPQQPAQNVSYGYAPNPVQQQAFTQQVAMPEEAPQNFYQRPMPQQGMVPSFSAQSAGYGYAPDESPMAAEQ